MQIFRAFFQSGCLHAHIGEEPEGNTSLFAATRWNAKSRDRAGKRRFSGARRNPWNILKNGFGWCGWVDHKAVVSYLGKLAHRGNPARNTLAIMREEWRKEKHGIDRRTARARPARHRWGCRERCCPVGTGLSA